MSTEKLITMDELTKAMDTLGKLYDVMRLIRPVSKKVFHYVKGERKESPFRCYELWAQGKVCNNCISMRALNERQICFKLEYDSNRIFTVIAVPIQDGDEIVVLELLKDVTNSMTISTPPEFKNSPLLKSLTEIGQLQIRDSLTGLFNRRFIGERLPGDILNCSIDKKPLSVIFADIDYFKKVNDTYGHVAGDEVLKEFARLLEKAVEGYDGWAARYGGEEFLIRMEGMDSTKVTSFAEAIREKIENCEFSYDGQIIKITSSFGIFTMNSDRSLSMEEFIERADKNLYAAKNGGRNQVVASGV